MKKFVTRASPYSDEDIMILNNLTGECAALKTKSLKKIRKQFKHLICDDNKFYMRHVTSDIHDKIKEMLPKHYIPNS